MYSLGDKAKNAKSSIIHIEGDPDHPINRGTLCPKGAVLPDFIKAPPRFLYPEYRAPGAAEWKRVSWDWAMERIAKLVKDDRDKNFIAKNKGGVTVNRRVEGLSCRLGNYRRDRVSYLQGGAEPGNRSLRQSSRSLTRPNGGQFGPNFRPWRDDQHSGGYQEREPRRYHGRQRRRSASLWFQVGYGSQGRKQETVTAGAQTRREDQRLFLPGLQPGDGLPP
jgi:hypothetical protein